MGRKLYVGNLPYSATESSLREAFAASGTVDYTCTYHPTMKGTLRVNGS